MPTRPRRIVSSISVCCLIVLGTTILASQVARPAPSDEQTARMVSEMLEHFHLNQTKIDDNISSKMLDRFLEEIDPQKLYFLNSDIEYFNQSRTKLDDQIKEGRIQFAYEVFNIFQKRMNEQLGNGNGVVHTLIDKPYTFDGNDEIVVDPKLLPWARTREELTARWEQRIKYNLLTLVLDGQAEAEARERLHRRYRLFATSMAQTDQMEVLEMYLSALTHTFDPHSTYMSPNTVDDFQINMSLSLEGIGAALRWEDGYTVVAEIIKGGAADEDGRLEVGDTILGVAQDNDTEFLDIVEMKLNKVVRFIRGKKGTTVRLQVKKASGTMAEYALVRKSVELTSSAVRGEVIEGQDRVGRPAKIGVLKIPSFYHDFESDKRGAEARSAAVDAERVLADFRQQDVDAVIVDLRNNGGGALSEAIAISGLFIDQGPVVQIREQNGRIQSLDDEVTGVAWDGPLVVICNRLSASASEIFAGVIADYGRGLIVGDDTTHGKGTVQNVMNVGGRLMQAFGGENRGALKLTIQQFYRVNGASTQNRGVRSDVVLPSKVAELDLGESFFDNALPFHEIRQAPYRNTGMLTQEVIAQLRTASQNRVAMNADWKIVFAEIEAIRKSKDRTTLPLNREKLEAEIKAAKETEKLGEELAKAESGNGDAPVFPDELYNDEVVNITVDLLGLTNNAATAANR